MNHGLDELQLAKSMTRLPERSKELLCAGIALRLSPHPMRLGSPDYNARIRQPLSDAIDRLFLEPSARTEPPHQLNASGDVDLDSLYAQESEAMGDEHQLIEIAVSSIRYGWDYMTSRADEDVVYCCRMLTDSVFLFVEATENLPEAELNRQAMAWEHPLLRSEIVLRDSLVRVVGDSALSDLAKVRAVRDLATASRADRGTIWGPLERT